MAPPPQVSGATQGGLVWNRIPGTFALQCEAPPPAGLPESGGAGRSSIAGPKPHLGSEAAGLQEDDGFYEAFLAPLETRMLRTVWRVVRDRQLAEDAIQDAFAVLWIRREQVRRHPNPEALVLRICLNVSCDAIRRHIRLRRREAPADMNLAGAAPLAATSPGPGEMILGEEVRAALGELPRNQAAAVLLRLFHEEPYSVIAGALGCSQTTARIHVMRGRARLRRLLSHARSSVQGEEGKPR